MHGGGMVVTDEVLSARGKAQKVQQLLGFIRV